LSRFLSDTEKLDLREQEKAAEAAKFIAEEHMEKAQFSRYVIRPKLISAGVSAVVWGVPAAVVTALTGTPIALAIGVGGVGAGQGFLTGESNVIRWAERREEKKLRTKIQGALQELWRAQAAGQ